MKLLVLSNISGTTDMVLDALGDSVNVVAKEANLATDAMAGIVIEQMNRRAYDRILIIAKDPIGAGIAMNKQEGIEAAVCGSVDDVRLANDNGANVIIIRDPHSKDFESILDAVAQSGGMLKGLKLNVKMPKLAPKQENVATSAPAALQRPKKKKPAPEEEQEEEAPQPEPAPEDEDVAPRKGVVGKLKDYLGIM